MNVNDRFKDDVHMVKSMLWLQNLNFDTSLYSFAAHFLKAQKSCFSTMDSVLLKRCSNFFIHDFFFNQTLMHQSILNVNLFIVFVNK